MTFMLMDLDRKAKEHAGPRTKTFQEMEPEEWLAQRNAMLVSESDDDLELEGLAADKDFEPGAAWLDFYRRTSPRIWRPMFANHVDAFKKHHSIANHGQQFDDLLANALAEVLAMDEVRDQPVFLNEEPKRQRVKKSRIDPDLTMEGLLEKWNTNRKPRPKTLDAAKTALKYFCDFTDNARVVEIVSADLFDFRDALMVLPNSMPVKDRALRFSAQVEKYDKDDETIERISPATVKKYLGAIQALLSYAFKEQLIPTNVSHGIAVEGYSKVSNSRQSFKNEELAKLFGAPLFTAPWHSQMSRSGISDETIRWLFLFGLTTGARIEEIGQALLADVMQEGGIWYINITEYVTKTVRKTSDVTKSVKNDNSRRIILIHDHLIKLGFLDYLSKLVDKGETKIYPDLRADKFSVCTKEASRRCARVIDQVVSKDERLVFHSLRHKFKALCRTAGIPMDVHDQITGHAPVSVGAGYGQSIEARELKDHVAQIDFAYIDWQAIELAAKAKPR
jgi:integrase